MSTFSTKLYTFERNASDVVDAYDGADADHGSAFKTKQNKHEVGRELMLVMYHGADATHGCSGGS